MIKLGCLVLCFLYFADITIVLFSNFILFLNFLHFIFSNPNRWWRVKSFFFFFPFCYVESFANSFQMISKINPIYTTRKTTQFFSIWCVLHFYDKSSSVPIPNFKKLKLYHFWFDTQKKTPTKKLKFQAWTKTWTWKSRHGGGPR
jgi:hypothetical protein